MITFLVFLNRAKDLLNGKNHLPDNKIRLNLLNRRVGFMGSGEYRSHFFGEKSALTLLKKAIEDQMKYSIPALNRKRKTRARLAWQTPLTPDPSSEGRGEQTPFPPRGKGWG